MILIRSIAPFLVVAALVWLNAAAAQAEDDEIKPYVPKLARDQSKIRWDIITGYWARVEFGDTQTLDFTDLVYLSKEGLQFGIYYNGHDGNPATVGGIVGQWRLIGREQFAETINSRVEHLLMATDERFCSRTTNNNNAEDLSPHYRDIDITTTSSGQYRITLDYDLDIIPPANPLQRSRQFLWKHYVANSPSTGGKLEGPWQKISKDQVPAWFRDLVAKNYIRKKECWPP